MFQALDWNTPARQFYQRIGAQETADWIPIRFEKAAIAEFLEKFDTKSTLATSTAAAATSTKAVQ